jgi:hypothetical protein
MDPNLARQKQVCEGLTYIEETALNPGTFWCGHIDQQASMGKQDRVARENVGLKIIRGRPLFFASQVSDGAEGHSTALSK